MKRTLTLLILASAALAETSTDAIDALRSLNSVIEVGPSFRDYAPRVLDAKIKVDKYLASAPKDDATAKQIATIMRIHVLAVKVWGATITKDRASAQRAAEMVAADPEIFACPGIQFEKHADPAEYAKVMAAASAALAAGGASEPTPEMKADWEKQRAAASADRERRKSIDIRRLEPVVFLKCAADKLDALKK